MMYPIDRGLFAKLAQHDPEEICSHTDCSYDTVQGAYVLPAWGDIYTVFPVQQRIECRRGKGPGPHSYFSVFLIHYLLNGGNADPVHEWISEKDIPGGATFFRGPHQIPTGMISGQYGNDIESFRRNCERLGGKVLSLADAAFSFRITSRSPVAVLYWRGDQDFAPEAKILFDRSLAGYLAADAVFALAVDVCMRLSGN